MRPQLFVLFGNEEASNRLTETSKDSFYSGMFEFKSVIYTKTLSTYSFYFSFSVDFFNV